jgi:hypothetical protein
MAYGTSWNENAATARCRDNGTPAGGVITADSREPEEHAADMSHRANVIRTSAGG